jgi:predicted protein tyrosine phosphatase
MRRGPGVRGWLSRYPDLIDPVLRVLFVCSQNRWRSPTAERIFGGHQGIDARSRGVAGSARRKLTATDVAWADLILVMEEEHRERLVEHHRDQIGSTPVHVLDIPDEYEYMDPELVEMLEAVVIPILHAEGSRAP